MTQLVWRVAGDRRFEAGLDRGVLYPPTGNCVVWNGLTSVKENSPGGDVTSYYMDGVRYLNIVGFEEFDAVLEGFSCPDEFLDLQGMPSNGKGLFFTAQPHKPFGLSYRTGLGNDLVGVDYGYKLHVVYNAISESAGKSYETMGDSPSPIKSTWNIATVPVAITGRRPTAHLIIDSTKASLAAMTAVENILYGTAGTNPRIPTVVELLALLV